MFDLTHTFKSIQIKISLAFALGVAMFGAGCATSTNGVVPIGQDTYMLGGLGQFTDYSGSAVKARFFASASQYCEGKGQTMEPLSSSARDSGFGSYASAEIQFRCVKKVAG